MLVLNLFVLKANLAKELTMNTLNGAARQTQKEVKPAGSLNESIEENLVF